MEETKEKPQVGALSFEFAQSGNCCGSTDDIEVIEIRLEDGGGGLYPVIKTDGWSFNEPSDIADLCQKCLDVASKLNQE